MTTQTRHNEAARELANDLRAQERGDLMQLLDAALRYEREQGRAEGVADTVQDVRNELPVQPREPHLVMVDAYELHRSLDAIAGVEQDPGYHVLTDDQRQAIRRAAGVEQDGGQPA